MHACHGGTLCFPVHQGVENSSGRFLLPHPLGEVRLLAKWSVLHASFVDELLDPDNTVDRLVETGTPSSVGFRGCRGNHQETQGISVRAPRARTACAHRVHGTPMGMPWNRAPRALSQLSQQQSQGPDTKGLAREIGRCGGRLRGDAGAFWVCKNFRMVWPKSYCSISWKHSANIDNCRRGSQAGRRQVQAGSRRPTGTRFAPPKSRTSPKAKKKTCPIPGGPPGPQLKWNWNYG